ncbi:glycosyltransferase [Marinilabiliaceae bacterium JC017]|nr:glycosyltransferase [Marinilabiliaceae bacterium JC017]
MKLSIITVTYNCASTLQATINSVKAQSFKEIEYIIIDGASTDDTLAIIKANTDIISHWISEPDQGIYDAMNKGIKRATGDWIGFLHADDEFASKNTLKTIINAIKTQQPQCLYGDLDYVQTTPPHKTLRHWQSCAFSDSLLHKGWMPPHPTLYLKKDLFDQLAAFNPAYKISADYEFVLRLFSIPGLKTCYLPEVLIKMKLGGASNRSLSNIITKSKEDLRAIKSNRIGSWGTLIMKNTTKLIQFIQRSETEK